MTHYNDIDEQLCEYGKKLVSELEAAYLELRDEGVDGDLVYAAYDRVYGPCKMPEIDKLALIRVAEESDEAYNATYEEVEHYIFERFFE